MSGTGSSSQSECSVYSVSTNNNRQQLVNYQQGFCPFNPEAQIPHAMENNSAGGQYISVTNIISEQCYHHHDQVTKAVENFNISELRTTHLPSDIFVGVNQNSALRLSCNCNVHIHNTFFAPTSTTGCCVHSQHGQFHPEFGNVSYQDQPAVGGNRLVCDV